MWRALREGSILGRLCRLCHGEGRWIWLYHQVGGGNPEDPFLPVLLFELTEGLHRAREEGLRRRLQRCLLQESPGEALQEALAIVDAKSGVTGAGRKPELTSHFAEVNEDLIPYKMGRVHRHVGEMEIVLTALAGENFRVLFTPQLAPFSRGILSTIYVRTAASAQEVVALYEKTYRREPFVHILEPGRPAQLAFVRHNNSCVLGVHQVPETSYILVTVAIDNLTNGAAGQAVQNFNILFGLDETAGLTGAGGNRR